MDFFHALIQQSFLQLAVVGGLLSSVAAGLIGTFVVVKRISYLAGGIAHATFAGLGIAYYFGFPPLGGALIFAFFAAILIGYVKLHFREHEDTLIGALWAVGMAVGIIFMYLKPGYQSDLFSYLFGNILMMTQNNLLLLVVIDAVLILLIFLFYRQLLFVSFDEEYARVRGMYSRFFYILLLVMIAMTVVILISSVGLILVIALLTLPPSTAYLFAKTPGQMMGRSMGISAMVILSGLFTAWQTNLPAGATIIILAGVVYLLAFVCRWIRNKWRMRQS